MDEREETEQVQPAGEQEPGGLVPPYEGRQTEMKDGYEGAHREGLPRRRRRRAGPGR
jgi:hypothetical protein